MGFDQILEEIGQGVTLVAVSKTKPVELIMDLYQKGHRDFGENKVQEIEWKKDELPKDIRWHFVGHLQRNKVKFLAPYVHLIHAVDSIRLAREIDKQGAKVGRRLKVLIQVHIADEESKFGIELPNLGAFMQELDGENFEFLEVSGLMGMATNTPDQEKVKTEFKALKEAFEQLGNEAWNSGIKMETLSIGMSGDYKTAIEEGGNMIRIGTKVFGPREQ